MRSENQQPTTNNQQPTIDWRYAYDLYRTGRHSIRQIAAEVGCDESAVRKRIATRKWNASFDTAHPEVGPNLTHKSDRLEVRDRHRRLLEEGSLRLQRLGRRLDKQLDANHDLTPEQVEQLVLTQWRWSRCAAILIGLERESYALEGDSADVERDYFREKVSESKAKAAQISPSTPQVQTDAAQVQNHQVRTADLRGLIAAQDTDEALKGLEEEFLRAEQLLAQLR